MFRIIVAALAIIGLVSVIGEIGSTVFLGVLALVPLLILLKLAFIAMLFGGFMKAGRRSQRGPDWPGDEISDAMRRMARGWAGSGRSRRRGRPSDQPTRSPKDRFDEWHDLAHARQEVDSWVDADEDE